MNKYYHGVLQATVDQKDVRAAWISNPRSGKGLTLLNKAFEIYHNAWEAIRRVTDSKMNEALISSLDKAANAGRGPSSYFGTVNSLADAFSHLEKNNGCWTDNNTDWYQGGAVSFLKAVDENRTQLRQCLGNCNDGMKELTESTDRWEQVGKALKGIEKYSKYVKP